MKKIILVVFIVSVLLVIAGYTFYKNYFSDVVANAIVADELPAYLPKKIQNKIDVYRKPANKGAEQMIAQMHKENIPVEKMISTIDQTTEEQANAIVAELNETKIQNADQLFDIGKKHLTADFDIEKLRKPFRENVDIKLVKKAMRYGNKNGRSSDIDFETTKAILKKIFIEKEKQYQAKN